MRIRSALIAGAVLLGSFLSMAGAAQVAGPYCFQTWADTACNAWYTDCGQQCEGYGTPVCVGTGEYTPDSPHCPWREIEACQCL
jgi:hypothetical protein